jgi:hypothetical protein
MGLFANRSALSRGLLLDGEMLAIALDEIADRVVMAWS